jgi:spore coat polysaccharide biosynthesis protein SpsF
MHPKIGIITQARMTSTRLPGKVLLTAGNDSILGHHVRRAQQSGYAVYVATTTNDTDQPIVAWCEQQKIAYYRGSETHVLSRYYACALAQQLDIVVRITSDCPLIDGDLIRRGVAQYLSLGTDMGYVSNGLQRSFPRGFDLEVFSFALLSEAYHQATIAADIEHVTPYIHQNRNGKVQISHLLNDTDKSQYRITLDTPEDYQLLKILIEEHEAQHCSYSQIIALLDQYPALAAINAHIEQKKMGE